MPAVAAALAEGVFEDLGCIFFTTRSSPLLPLPGLIRSTSKTEHPMKKTFSFLSLVLAATLSLQAQAYDEALAARIDREVTGQMDRQFFVTKPCKVEAVDVLQMLAKGEKVTLLDMRTPEEMAVVGLTHPKALAIPMHALFKKENLDRLPRDGKIVVICHSGNRAAGSTALLKAVGFKDVVYVNGGLISLVTNLTPKTVPMK
jgi:rhodanese-related sulfurtransferase